MEEQGAVYSIYQFCTIYTTITSMLWVSVFAVLIIFLGRSLNFKRNYSFNVLWALVILFFLRFILNFEIPYYTSGLRSYVYLEAVREALRHCLYIFSYEDDFGKVYYYLTIGKVLEIFYLFVVIVLLVKKYLKCKKLYKIIGLLNFTEDKNILNTLEVAKKKVGVKKDIKIIVNKSIRTPAIIGYFKPIIVLPLVELNHTQIVTILSHELIHYKYKHIFIKILTEFICAVKWINPIFIILKKEIFNILEFFTDRKLIAVFNHEEKRQYLQGIIKIVENYGNKNNKLGFSIGLDEENNERVMLQRFKMVLENSYINKNRFKSCISIFVFVILYIFSYSVIIQPAGKTTMEDYNDDVPIIIDGSYVISDGDRGYTIYSPEGEILTVQRGKFTRGVQGFIMEVR